MTDLVLKEDKVNFRRVTLNTKSYDNFKEMINPAVKEDTIVDSYDSDDHAFNDRRYHMPKSDFIQEFFHRNSEPA